MGNARFMNEKGGGKKKLTLGRRKGKKESLKKGKQSSVEKEKREGEDTKIDAR